MATLTNNALLAQLRQAIDLDKSNGAPVPSVNERLEAQRVAITGQQTPPPPTGWPMSNNRSATRLNLLEPRVDTQEQTVAVLRAQVATLADLLGSTRADLLPRLTLAEAAQLANTAADVAEATKQEQVRLKTVALESKQQNTDAALALVQAKQGQSDAALALVQTRLTQDEAAIAQAQQAVTAADAKAVAAQATATAAKAKADADEVAAAEARTIALAARDTSNANQVALNTLNARFRLKRLPVPAIGIGATGTLNVVWDTPYLDDNYNAVAQVEGVALLGLSADVTARTAAGCTVQLKNGLGIGITLAAATVSITATHY